MQAYEFVKKRPSLTVGRCFRRHKKQAQSRWPPEATRSACRMNQRWLGRHALLSTVHKRLQRLRSLRAMGKPVASRARTKKKSWD